MRYLISLILVLALISPCESLQIQPIIIPAKTITIKTEYSYQEYNYGFNLENSSFSSREYQNYLLWRFLNYGI